MKVPFSWMKEFVPVKASAEEVARRLTFAGLEVEGIAEIAGDKILEINVTANRGDCLSVLGIAREVAALYSLRLSGTGSGKARKSASGGTILAAKVVKPALCPRYQLAVLKGVRVGPSPDWLSRRLEQAGIRSINNVVDVTNYVLIERGQPLHAFDLGKIKGQKIVVRLAQDGEKIKTLDGVERVLKPQDLVIADDSGPVALAGVMGGLNSEVDERTTSIALECAFFEPDGVRRSARRLGIQTESSYRFERRVDPEGLDAARERAIMLILQLAGGSLEGAIVDRTAKAQPANAVTFDPGFIRSYLGGEWKESECKRLLQSLSFEVTDRGKKGWQVIPPSYRGDIERPQDIVEEVARLAGYERIPVRFPALKSPPPSVDGRAELARRTGDLLTDMGFAETIHYGFMSPDETHGVTGILGGGLAGLMLENPLGREFSLMRPSLLPGLLQSAIYHQSHKMETLRLFELGSVFASSSKGVVEKRALGALMMGARPTAHWSQKSDPSDFFDLKGVVDSLLKTAHISDVTFQPTSLESLHPRKQCEALWQGRRLGLLGEIHPDLQSRLELKQAVQVFEMDWDVLSDASQSHRFAFYPYGRFPVVERDLAIVLDDEIPAGKVVEHMKSEDAAVREVSVFDLYRGHPIPAGKKSVAFAVRLARDDRTMTDAEVNEIYGRLVAGVKQSFNAEVR